MLKTKDGYAKVIGTSYQGSSDYLLLSNGDSKAISSLSVNYANDADKLDGEHASNFVRAGVIDTDVTDLNALDTYSFIKSVNSEVADHSPKGNTGWYNVIQLVHRNGSGDGSGYIGQIALGMTTNTNDMFFRGKRTDSWKTVIHSGNIADQSVKYATSAGSVAWNNVTGKPSTFAPSKHTHKWADITDHITKLSQLTNDKGFVTGSVSDNTITINGSSTTWSDTWRPITDDYELGESDTSLSSLGSLTLYTDLLGSIPNPTDYYWANNKISSTSKINAEVRVTNLGAGCSTTIENTIMATNWLRAKGSTGIYFQDHGGGLYMSDDTWIRTWAGKALQVDNTIRSTDFHTTYYANNVWTITSAARLENSTTLIYGFGTSSNSINTYLRGTNITLQVKKDTSINYNAFQVTADETRCFNYFNMKGGATVSKGNFTVQNNTYLAQEKDAKVSIGNISSDSKLTVSGDIKANNINLHAKDYKYHKQPICIVCGSYIDSPAVFCNTKTRIISSTKGYYLFLFEDIQGQWDFNKITLFLTLHTQGMISGIVRNLSGSLGIEVRIKVDNTDIWQDFDFMIWSWDN